MREIKFRGKNIDTGEWIYGDLVQWNRLGLYAVLPQEGDYWSSPNDFKVEPKTVGQFTGLQDKNGVEIYEGDILSYRNPYSNSSFTHLVKWDAEQSCFALFKMANERWASESDWMKIDSIEILGNIHDNPELLKN